MGKKTLTPEKLEKELETVMKKLAEGRNIVAQLPNKEQGFDNNKAERDEVTK